MSEISQKIKEIKELIKRIANGELILSEEIFEDLKEKMASIPRKYAFELAYLIALQSSKTDLGDFWYFANYTRNTVWFCKLMGVSAFFAFEKGKDYQGYIREGEANAEKLILGFRSLGYTMLAEYTCEIDANLGYNHLKDAFKFFKFADASIVGGTLFIFSKICVRKNYDCLSMLESMIKTVMDSDDLSLFDKIDILNYFSEIIQNRYIDLSLKAIKKVFGYLPNLEDPELKELSILLTAEAVKKLTKISPNLLNWIGELNNEESKRVLMKIKPENIYP
ncbi:MAG: hypothetical protein ACP6IP_08375 [Candidatus Njordarchaeia archaeon]